MFSPVVLRLARQGGNGLACVYIYIYIYIYIYGERERERERDLSTCQSGPIPSEHMFYV